MITTIITCACGTQTVIDGCGERHQIIIRLAAHGWDTDDTGIICPACAHCRAVEIEADYQRNQIMELRAAADLVGSRPQLSELTREQFLAAAAEHEAHPGACLGDCPAETETTRLLTAAVA